MVVPGTLMLLAGTVVVLIANGFTSGAGGHMALDAEGFASVSTEAGTSRLSGPTDGTSV